MDFSNVSLLEEVDRLHRLRHFDGARPHHFRERRGLRFSRDSIIISVRVRSLTASLALAGLGLSNDGSFALIEIGGIVRPCIVATSSPPSPSSNIRVGPGDVIQGTYPVLQLEIVPL